MEHLMMLSCVVELVFDPVFELCFLSASEYHQCPKQYQLHGPGQEQNLCTETRATGQTFW